MLIGGKCAPFFGRSLWVVFGLLVEEDFYPFPTIIINLSAQATVFGLEYDVFLLIEKNRAVS